MVISQKTEEITRVKDILPEERADIEEMLTDGYRPLAITKQYPNIPIGLIQNIQRMMKMKNYSVPIMNEVKIVPEQSEAMLEIQRQMSEMKMKFQLEQMKDELEDAKAKRRLDLEQRRLDLRRQRLEMREDYGDEGEEGDEETEEPQQQGINPFEFGDSGGEYGFLRDIMRFVTVLAAKPPKSTLQTQPQIQTTEEQTTVTPDFTKPLTKEQVNAELKKFSPEQIKMAAQYPKLVEERLKKEYPGIIPENLKTISDSISEYVANT